MPPPKRHNAADSTMRKEYQKLLQHVATAGDTDDDGELRNERSDTRISNNLHRAEALFEVMEQNDKGSATEMAMDASVFRHISVDIKNRVQRININDTAFKFSEYATKIAARMNTEKDDETKTFKTLPHRWQCIGKEMARTFRRVPSLGYLYGSMGEEPEARAAKIAKVKAPRIAVARKVSATKVVTRRPAVEVDEDMMVKKMVESLHADLHREWRKNNKSPVNFYEFVCHPTSFANTVENIFHVSFLIKERKVSMVDNEESSLPELEPLDGNAAGARNIDTDQRVVNINMRQWRQFVMIFDIKEGKEMVKRKSNEGDEEGCGSDEGEQ